MSQICSLMVLWLRVRLRDPNYTPMVGSDSILNSLSMNCMRMQDFPTPSYRRANSDHR